MLVRALILLTTILAGCTSPGPTDAGPTDPAPPEPAGATYDVFPPTAQFGDPPRGTVHNSGGVPLEYPHGFVLDTLYEGTWRTVRTPEDPDYPCSRFPTPGLVLHPGRSRSQRITACDFDGQPAPLFPGRYRVTKTLLTIPTESEEPPSEIVKVVEFEVAEPVAEIPDPDACEVLCISDTHVEGGQNVRVSFAPPLRYSWGVPSELHAGTTETVWPLAYLTAWQDKDEELRTSWLGQPVGWEDIDFHGSGSWRWEVPERLGPGIYSIVKTGLAGSVRIPIEKRRTTWSVTFEVEG
ncbi:MAG: hypothetical protein M3323_14155 [Actinomycetota bacterium]|nr:hypothetical protein [Actinomycetota bacterium]